MYKAGFKKRNQPIKLRIKIKAKAPMPKVSRFLRGVFGPVMSDSLSTALRLLGSGWKVSLSLVVTSGCCSKFDSGSLVSGTLLSLSVGGPATSEIAFCRLKNPGCPFSVSQFIRSAACTRRNSNGICTSSINTGTRIPLLAPSDASVFTQLDATEAFDQMTMTQRAESSASSITSSKVLPGGIVLSHQTDQPCFSSVLAICSTLGLSSFA